MDAVFLNPNVTYVFLVGGFTLALIAILTPGTGVLEISALFALAIAGWGVYNLSINYWALGVLILGVFPFIWVLRKSGQKRYLGLSILCLIVGSVFLFHGENSWLPAVHPALATVVSLLTGGFFWIVTTKTLEASNVRPAHDLSPLIGAIGETKTEVHHKGSVQVAGELWSARSKQPIPAGAVVRVISREGLILDVELATSTERLNQSPNS